jgi:hypothetical protein
MSRAWKAALGIVGGVCAALAAAASVVELWEACDRRVRCQSAASAFWSGARLWFWGLAGFVLVAMVVLALWWFRRPVARGVKRLRWWVLWRRLERDVRSRIEGLSQVGAEVLAATLRLGERRQDRRLFLSIREAEALVRAKRYPPQAGVGGTAWLTKGCEELQRAGLVEQYGDARDQTWMVWLDKRVTGSRVGGRLLDVVEGMLASRGQWRW